MAKKILIVDDEAPLLELMRDVLMTAGYDVVTASDALMAVQIAHREKPQLLILDNKMPAGGGVAVYDNLKKSSYTASIPIIFVTAYPTDAIKERAAKNNYFLLKPFKNKELVELIQSILKDNVSSKEE